MVFLRCVHNVLFMMSFDGVCLMYFDYVYDKVFDDDDVDDHLSVRMIFLHMFLDHAFDAVSLIRFDCAC